jgi:hypothetical protein
MDLAVSAVVPQGLPGALLPIYQFLYGILLKKKRVNIGSVTTKAILIVSAVMSAKLIWDWSKPMILNTFTSSVSIPKFNRMYQITEAYLLGKASKTGRVPRHVGLTCWQRVLDAKPTTYYRRT